ncbi:hypothetical protein AB0O22_22450 [Streptomyces sp. NPDC091204]|uniref:hypothetical protein n=1 Tax=Streptomyces sp. NPDC091204 TaxID=3155299 RepID=UPI00343FA332
MGVQCGRHRGHPGRLRHRRDPLVGHRITAVNGKANGSAFAGAVRDKVINVGDTLALRRGA